MNGDICPYKIRNSYRAALFEDDKVKGMISKR